MRSAKVFVNNILAGTFVEISLHDYRFTYEENYQGLPISLTMPLDQKVYEFKQFPSFFEGLLPEGQMLEAMLRKYKIDKNDYFAQLIQVGHDVVGAVTIEHAS